MNCTEKLWVIFVFSKTLSPKTSILTEAIMTWFCHNAVLNKNTTNMLKENRQYICNFFPCTRLLENVVGISHPCTGLDRALELQEAQVPGISRQSAHEGGKVVSPMHWLPVPRRGYPWYLFLLEAELTPGPWCGRKDYVNEKSQWHDLLLCRAEPQPTAPPQMPIRLVNEHITVVSLLWC